MAWTPAQEKLVSNVLGSELSNRRENSQPDIIAKLFDPATPTAVRTFLAQKLNALKTADQASLAALPARTASIQTALTAEIALIDSVLATLVLKDVTAMEPALTNTET